MSSDRVECSVLRRTPEQIAELEMQNRKFVAPPKKSEAIFNRREKETSSFEMLPGHVLEDSDSESTLSDADSIEKVCTDRIFGKNEGSLNVNLFENIYNQTPETLKVKPKFNHKHMVSLEEEIRDSDMVEEKQKNEIGMVHNIREAHADMVAEEDEIEEPPKKKPKNKRRKNDVNYIETEYYRGGSGLYKTSGAALDFLSKKSRNALIHNMAFEIDQSASCQNILVLICREKGYTCMYINKYLIERQSIVKNLAKQLSIGEHHIKKYFCGVINGLSLGGFKRDLEKDGIEIQKFYLLENNIFVKAYTAEIKSIQKRMREDAQFQRFVHIATIDGKFKMGTFMSKILSTFQQVIVSTIAEFIGSQYERSMQIGDATFFNFKKSLWNATDHFKMAVYKEVLDVCEQVPTHLMSKLGICAPFRVTLGFPDRFETRTSQMGR